MIVDSHAHIFPYFGGPSGYQDINERMTYLQRATASGQGSNIRDRRTHRPATMSRGALWDPDTSGPEGMKDVGFRVGRNGRTEWTLEGEDYYVQTFPPLMEDMVASPETIVAMMDWAGIDKAVLQNDHIYGCLNQYFSLAANRFPGRFIGLIQVDEADVDSNRQIALLDSCVAELGLRGVYFKTLGLFRREGGTTIDSLRFQPFWDRVSELRLPVFWDMSPAEGTEEATFRQLREVLGVLERNPRIRGVLQGGVLRLFGSLAGEEAARVPDEVVQMIQGTETLLEILLPIFGGGRFEYPYKELRGQVLSLYDAFGPKKLVWGSDVPNVERYCTYRQSLTYITRYCESIPKPDLDRIVGGNLTEMFSND